jgi:glycosyltransferase involved in cell wall biosynthesis
MISATILAKNGKKHIEEVLSSLQFLDEVVLLDNGSTDGTTEIAAKFANVKIYTQEGFEGFGKAHQAMEALANNDWILSIDADEVVSQALADEILSEPLDEQTVYKIRFDNYYMGQHIKGCGWSPDYKYRLYNRKVTGFDDREVHENIKLGGLKIKELKASAKHYSFDSAADFLRKIQNYSELYAKEYRGKKSSSPSKALFRSIFAFFKSYILQKGCLDGYGGFIVSCYSAQWVFWKYIKLYEINRKSK